MLCFSRAVALVCLRWREDNLCHVHAYVLMLIKCCNELVLYIYFIFIKDLKNRFFHSM